MALKSKGIQKKAGRIVVPQLWQDSPGQGSQSSMNGYKNRHPSLEFQESLRLSICGFLKPVAVLERQKTITEAWMAATFIYPAEQNRRRFCLDGYSVSINSKATQDLFLKMRDGSS